MQSDTRAHGLLKPEDALQLSEESQRPPADLNEAEQRELALLYSELVSGNEARTMQALLQVRDLVFKSNPRHRSIQDGIAFWKPQGSFIQALVNLIATQFKSTAYYAACALAQLAWTHGPNSFLIVTAPHCLTNVYKLLASRDMSLNTKAHAAILLGNCGANSPEAAYEIISSKELTFEMTRIIRDAKQGERLQEVAVLALKNCVASSEEAALTLAINKEAISTIINRAKMMDASERIRDLATGTLNSISRSPRAATHLNHLKVSELVLEPVLREAKVGYHVGASWKKEQRSSAEDLRMLTVTCALVNINSINPSSSTATFRDFLDSRAGETVTGNMVSCLWMAIAHQRWHNISFSPDSVLVPLRNLALCRPSLLPLLASLGVIEPLHQVLKTFQSCTKSLMCLGLGCELLCMLSSDRALHLKLNRLGILPTVHLMKLEAEVRQIKEGPEGLAWAAVALFARETEDRLTEAPFALLMALHPRLGRNSQLMPLDEAVLSLIIDYAFFG